MNSISTQQSMGQGGGYLFATFQGEATPLTEQVYFVVSNDGRNWRALNAGQPILVSDLGDKGVRDPFLVRLHDGQGFILLATDLSIHHTKDWQRAQEAASRAIVIWASDDLIHWSPPRLVPIAPDDAGCAWAPEAVYDAKTGDYLVFWASKTRRDNFAKQRIWASRTLDFKTFSEPFMYIDKPHHVIDTDIVSDGNTYYRFSKDEQYKAITLECATDVIGPWVDIPEFSLAKLVGYEGPVAFKLASGEWCLLLDHYAESKGYEPFLCHDLAGGRFVPTTDFRAPLKLRHGGVLPITASELKRLELAFA